MFGALARLLGQAGHNEVVNAQHLGHTIQNGVAQLGFTKPFNHPGPAPTPINPATDKYYVHPLAQIPNTLQQLAQLATPNHLPQAPVYNPLTPTQAPYAFTPDNKFRVTPMYRNPFSPTLQADPSRLQGSYNN